MTNATDVLLFEIGSEELPAGFVDPALAFLETELPKQLAEHRLSCSNVVVDGTPRRLMVRATVGKRQADLEEEITGPLWTIAFGADGTPTPAGEGFLRKNNLRAEDCVQKEGKKGPVVAATRREAGKAATDVLPALLEALIPRIPFKKTMRWGDRHATNGQVFGRPVQWILAIFGSATLPVRFADVTSSNTTRGHRYHAPAAVVVESVSEYERVLENGSVVLSRRRRAQEILDGARALAKAEGGQLVEDESLVELVKNLVEKPFPLLGRFDASFLEVPKELLISEAREHQKYFMITDREGKLMPCFVVVAGAESKEPARLAAGNARVLRARFEDGAFYYRTDLERRLESRLVDLEKLVFHKELGHYGDKALRLASIAGVVVDQISDELTERGADATKVGEDAMRAAKLAKTDLLSGVVNEFPELQGVMGRYYALNDGESVDVAWAMEEQYAPRHAGAALPRSHVGAVVALADRLDTLVGILGIGKAPTGSADPYALRRAAIAMLSIVLEKGYAFALRAVVGPTVDAYQQQGRLQKIERETQIATVVDFIVGRLKGVLKERAVETGLGDVSDVVDAALAAEGGLDDLPEVWRRVEAVATFRARDIDGFSALAATFKRVGNIVKKAREDGAVVTSVVPATEELELPAERELASLTRTLQASTSHLDTLHQVAELRPAVDRFFEDVMVMVDDERLRTARLNLLGAIERRLVNVADFTRLQ